MQFHGHLCALVDTVPNLSSNKVTYGINVQNVFPSNTYFAYQMLIIYEQDNYITGH